MILNLQEMTLRKVLENLIWKDLPPFLLRNLLKILYFEKISRHDMKQIIREDFDKLMKPLEEILEIDFKINETFANYQFDRFLESHNPHQKYLKFIAMLGMEVMIKIIGNGKFYTIYLEDLEDFSEYLQTYYENNLEKLIEEVSIEMKNPDDFLEFIQNYRDGHGTTCFNIEYMHQEDFAGLLTYYPQDPEELNITNDLEIINENDYKNLYYFIFSLTDIYGIINIRRFKFFRTEEETNEIKDQINIRDVTEKTLKSYINKRLENFSPTLLYKQMESWI